MVCPRVCQYKKAGLAEGCLKLVGEGTGCVSPGNGMSTCVLCKLQDSSLTVRPCWLDNDILRVLDGNNDPSRQLEFLPSFTKIDDVNSWFYKKEEKYFMNSSPFFWYDNEFQFIAPI